ncbi:hypothetical protein KAT08_02430 [Candidatus Babeliales bacterium]|nr:hypothetical protein [Candidatus Babeliales bacterium]
MLGKKVIIGFYILLILFLLPSCIKYYKLEKDEFPQGKDLEDKREIVDANLRRVAVYDQFATKAIFDVLWLSNDTREAYVDINCKKNGKDDQEKRALLRRQLEENKHWNSFYVLADVRDKINISLTDKNSIWSLYVVGKDEDRVRPISIKEVDLEPEYQFLFGPIFNFLKRIYLVKFPAASLDGKRYIKKDGEFKLIFSSAGKQNEACWGRISDKKKKKEKILKNEDYYWI